MSDFFAIIPAGGVGSRLWPLSVADRPKFLLDLTGSGKSLLQETLARLADIASGAMVVTGTRHLEAVAEQLPELGEQDFFAEPMGKNSMAAIAVAAELLQRRYGDVVVGSFAADHVIEDLEAFQTAARLAISAAESGQIAVLGIEPSFASTAYGYILAQPSEEPVRRVANFVEKPDEVTAAGYLEMGNCYWNAGMYFAKTSVLLNALAEFEPDLRAGITEIADLLEVGDQESEFLKVWAGLKSIAIDHAIAENLAPRGGIDVVPVSMGWSDLGDFEALGELTSGQEHISIESQGSRVFGVDRPVAILGIENAIVAMTPKSLLVTTTVHAQQVKTVVDRLTELGRTELL